MTSKKRERAEDELSSALVCGSKKAYRFHTILCDIKQILNNNNDIFKETGRQLEEKIPQFVLFGNQSSGKSSIVRKLIKKFTNVDFQFYINTGCATKLPIHINFRYHQQDDKMTIGLQDKENNALLHTYENLDDFNRDMIKEELKKCLKFKLVIDIFSIKCTNFTIIDLPGLIVSSNSDDDYTINIINTIVSEYINMPNTTVIHVINLSIDISNSSSYRFIKQTANIPIDKQIIVGTQLDLATQRSNNGVNQVLSEFISFFGQHKSFLVQSSDKNGIISYEKEEENLNSILTQPHKFIIGNNKLFDEIHDKLDKFWNENKHSIMNLLKKIEKDYCNDIIDKIGFDPIPPQTSIFRWKKYIDTIKTKHLLNDRYELNSLGDFNEKTHNLLISCQYTDGNFKIIQNIIEDTQKKRGTQIKGLVTEDLPVKGVIKMLTDELFSNLKLFEDNILVPNINNILSLMIDLINKNNPNCIKITDLLNQEWNQIVENLIKKYRDTIHKQIKTITENPEFINGNVNNRKRIYTQVCIEEYKQKMRGTEPTLDNFIRWNNDQLINKHESDINDQIKVVYSLVNSFWNEFNQTLIRDIRSHIRNMGTEMYELFENEYTTSLINKLDLVEESEVIVYQRNIIKNLMECIQKIK